MTHQILVLDSGGIPQSWVKWKAAVRYRVKGQIAWSCGDESVFHGGLSRLTGLQSTVSVPSIIAVRASHRIIRSVPPLTNRSLFGRDLHTCGYCGNQFPAEKLTRDHIVPVSRNGKDVWSNCVTACKRCNNKKDNRLLEETSMQLLYVPYVPDRNEALLLQNRNILAEQMAFLNDYLPRHSRLRLS